MVDGTRHDGELKPLPAWLWTTIAILADGAVGLVGALIPNRWILGRSSPFVGFAAGAMLAVVFIDIMPEAVELIPVPRPHGCWGASWRWCSWTGECDGMRHGTDARRVVPATLLAADGLHNVTDGAAIAASFLISPKAGLITTLAVIVHEVPEEVGDFAILMRGGMAKGPALLWLGLVQLSAAIGAVATFVAATVFAQAAGAALAVAGGTFLYIALATLLPDVLERQPDRRSRTIGVVAFVIGVAAVTVPSILW